MSVNDAPKENTDRELWRETTGDYYAPSLFVTESGGIGMNVGGVVVVKPIREWHALVWDAPRSEPSEAAIDAAEREYWTLFANAREAMRAGLRAAYAIDGVRVSDAPPVPPVYDDEVSRQVWLMDGEQGVGARSPALPSVAEIADFLARTRDCQTIGDSDIAAWRLHAWLKTFVRSVAPHEEP